MTETTSGTASEPQQSIDPETWSPGPLRPASTAARTPLPFRVELARQFTQWRIRGLLLVLALLPIAIRIAFLIGTQPDDGSTTTDQTLTLADTAQDSGVLFATFTLSVTGGFLLTLVVALLFGDMIASEASRSTLKYLLTIPVSRGRLLATKIGVSLVVFATGLVLLAGVALIVGLLSYGNAGLQVPEGPQLSFGASIARIAGAIGFLFLHLLWAAALGTLLTVVTDTPLGAAGGVVLATILSNILDAIPTLGNFRYLLPTHFSGSWRQLFASPTNWDLVANSVLSSLIYALIFGVWAAWHFGRKDISS